MKKFRIYHPFNGELNTLCQPQTFEYKYVAFVEVENIHRVFKAAQNDFNPLYATLGIRNTCVGDIIQDENNNLFLIRGTMLTGIGRHWLEYIDWGNHMYMNTDPNILEPVPEEITYCVSCGKEECICLELENVREI